MGMQYSRGLVAGYPFENSANDIMGVNNGTVNGAVYVDGQCGRALSFDGVDDYVDLGTTVYCPTNSAWSVALRFKIPSGTIPTYGGLFSLKSAVGSGDFVLFYSPGSPYYLSCGFGNSGLSGKSTNYLLSRDVWHHCVVVYAGASSFPYLNHKLYLNGVKEPSSIQAFGKIISNNFIGKYLNNPSKSIIENVQIFNRALTVNEIKRLYLNLGI